MQQVGDETLFWTNKQPAKEENDVSTEMIDGMNYLSIHPGSFHYLVSEQAKSMVALHELQNDVGELLQFRDLVIETFPDLCHKLTLDSIPKSSFSNVHQQSFHCSHGSQKSHGTTVSPCTKTDKRTYPACRNKLRKPILWEPGVIKRRVVNNSGAGNGNNFCNSSSNDGKSNEIMSLPRSRSNSQTFGNKISTTIQDSGFSTETSSKDSNYTQMSRPATSKQDMVKQNDELWCLLDLIQKKGTQLREEVDGLQSQLETYFHEDIDLSHDISQVIQKITNHNTEECDKLQEDNLMEYEKMQLLNKVAELESNTIDSHARVQELQAKIESLSHIQSKRNSGENIAKRTCGTPNKTHFALSSKCCTKNCNGINHAPEFATASTPKNNSYNKFRCKNRFRTRSSNKKHLRNFDDATNYDISQDTKRKITKLGLLDNILGPPDKIKDVKEVPTEKIAAILKEQSSLELQRQLITTTIHNQILQKKMTATESNNKTLTDNLLKTREENDDFRFQLVERNIELEGTRARLRVLERLQQRPLVDGSQDVQSANLSSPDIEKNIDNESLADSTVTAELSAGCDMQVNAVKCSPRLRPSRIPKLDASTKTNTSKLSPASQCRRSEGKEACRSLTSRPSSLNSNSNSKSPKTPNSSLAKDSSRESLNKSPTKFNSKEFSRDLPNRSLTRINCTNKDSLPKAASNQNDNDQISLDSNSNTSKKPPVPSKRSRSQVVSGRQPQTSTTNENESGKVQSVKQFFWTTWLK